MKLFSLLMTAAVSFAANAAEIAAENYPYRKTVEIPASQERPSAFYIPVDTDIYLHTEPGLANLRILSNTGEQVPYLISPIPDSWKTVSSYAPVPGKIVGFHHDQAANIATVEYELNTERPVGQLSLRTAVRDFNKTITLEFDDGSKVENLAFFNHSEHLQFQNNTFEFTPRSAKRVKIRIANFSETKSDASALEHRGEQDSFTEVRVNTRDLSLEQITFSGLFTQTMMEAATEVRPVKVLSREKIEGKTQIQFEAQRQKTVALHIHTATPEYSRAVTVTAIRRRGESETERTFTCTVTPKHPDIPLRGDFRADKYTVAIANGDDPELADLSITATVEQEALLTEGATVPGGTLQVLYGGDRLAAPDYGLKNYVGKFYGKQWKALTASPEQSNPVYRQKILSSDTSRKFFNQAVIWMIAAVAAVLAVVAWKNFSKIKIEEGE